MSAYTVKLDIEKYEEIKAFYLPFKVDDGSDYLEFRSRFNDVLISFYTSNKSKRTIIFDGVLAEEELNRWNIKPVIKEKKKVVKTEWINLDTQIGSDEVGVGDFLAQLPAQAGGHIVVVGLRDDVVVIAAQIVVAGHGNQGEVLGEIGLEKAHGIVQEAGVGFGGGCVALDKVAHLEHEAGIVVHQAGGAVNQRRAALGPHFAIADEFLAVIGLPFGVGISVAGVVYFRVHRIIVGVSEDHYRILVLFLQAILGKYIGRPAQQRCAQRRSGGILEKISPFHRLANVASTKIRVFVRSENRNPTTPVWN